MRLHVTLMRGERPVTERGQDGQTRWEGGQPGEWISQVYEKCRGEVLLESQIQFHESGESRVTEISQEKTRLELETEALEQRLE